LKVGFVKQRTACISQEDKLKAVFWYIVCLYTMGSSHTES
jgi:hypothetical protein